jgi:phospholipid-binding lipoprotein MlaA
VRDAIGIYGVEPFLDLNFYIDYPGIEYTVLGLRVVNERAELLPADRLVREAALDRYSFIRDGYLQRRRSLVYDGNPPREIDPDDDDAGESDAKAPATGRDASSRPAQAKPASDPGDGAGKPADAKPGDAAK